MLLAQTDALSAGIMAACVAAMMHGRMAASVTTMVHGRDWLLGSHPLIWAVIGIAIHGIRMLPVSFAPRSWYESAAVRHHWTLHADTFHDIAKNALSCRSAW